MDTRKLKFMAWLPKIGLMLSHQELLKDIATKRGPSGQKCFDPFDHPEYVILESTGQHDTEGTEIYNHQILKFNGGAEDFYAEVDYEDGQYIVKMPWITNGSYPELKAYTLFAKLGEGKKFKDCLKLWVAGDIFRTPELLKRRKR